MANTFVKKLGRITVEYDPEYDGDAVSIFCISSQNADTAAPHENMMSLESARDLYYALGRLLNKVDGEC